ncbi:MAG: hypothetical protein Q4F84_03670, partial [Fibrobacter sp.]|nr:hypothetical protein [Fibrobacter sp.]
MKSKDASPKKPSWVLLPPVSKISFIGVGSAAISDDLGATQKLARDRALKNITEQIRVNIVSDMLQQSTATGVNDSWKVSEVYEEKIAMFA